MKTQKYNERSNAEDVFILSKDENTLPRKYEIQEMIKKFIPKEYVALSDRAYYSPWWGGKTTIHYDINQVYHNGYRVSVYYEYEGNDFKDILRFFVILVVLAAVIGFILRTILGKLNDTVSTITTICIALFAIISIVKTRSDERNSAIQNCDKLVSGIREYERAHMMSLK